MARGRQARPAPGALLEGSSDALRETDGEHALGIDALFDFAEAGGADQLIQLLLSPTTHDPRRTLSMAGEGACNELELGMPGLAGINELSARRQSVGEAGEGLLNAIVFGEELEEAGHNSD